MPNDSRRTRTGIPRGRPWGRARHGLHWFPPWAPRRRIHSPIPPTTCSCSWLSVAAPAVPTVSTPGIRAGGCDSDYAAHIGDRADERQALIRTRAQAQAESISMFVGRSRRDRSDTDHGPRSRLPDDSMGCVTGHRRVQKP